MAEINPTTVLMKDIDVDLSLCPRVDPYQDLDELVEDIRVNGQISPIFVFRRAHGYKLINGYRRYLALQSMEAQTVWVTVGGPENSPAHYWEPHVARLQAELANIPGYLVFRRTEALLFHQDLRIEGRVSFYKGIIQFDPVRGLLISYYGEAFEPWHAQPRRLTECVAALDSLQVAILQGAEGRIEKGLIQ